MPEDFVKPKSVTKPDVPDDLKAIAGIGPKLESVLNSSRYLDLCPDRRLDALRGRLARRLPAVQGPHPA
jgi:hypothetical protein